ncbi:MAG: hypothetical protein LAP40_20770 [Acidobacteriia bacterium]|nr:hypothetical protein [Terriglobia bacterium]
MDALLIVPAVAATFGGTYYLGKACLMLFVSSLEHSRNAKPPAATRNELPARALRSANTLVS